MVLIADEAAATRLAEQLLDGSRRRPVLGIAVPEAEQATRIDLRTLADYLPGGEVCLLVGSEATWSLKRSLPPGLDVYGRAARLWWPSSGGLLLREHPVGLLDERYHIDGQPLVAWLEAQLSRGPQGAEAVETRGLAQQAVVLDVDAERAVVRLADGGTAELSVDGLAGAGCTASSVVQVAQTLRVRVPPAGPGQRRTVAPVWSPAEARRHLADQCPAGSTILGRVASLRSHGALISLLPGIVGTLSVSEVANGWVRHVEDHLTVGDIVAARVIDYEQDRPALSLLGTSSEPIRPSLLPDGPPWLESRGHSTWDAPPLATELPEGRGFGDDPSETRDVPGEEERLLTEVMTQAQGVRDELIRVVGTHDRRMSDLRSEARHLLSDLQRDLAAARERLISTTSGSVGDLIGSAEEALLTARQEVARLRRELRAHTEERAEVTARAQAAEARAARAERLAEEHRHRADLHAGTAAALRVELERHVPESQRLLEQIRASWVHNTTHADREEFPWRDPVLGSGFLRSLHRVEGISIERVYDVCAEVVCGRAQRRRSLAVHPLRATDTSGSPQQTRDDGARAFRASLQSRTSAARRLHFWLLPDGRVELAKIGYHDDFTI